MQVANLGKEEIVVSARWIRRLALFAVFLICGLAIFVFGCNYFDAFSTNRNLNYQLLLSATFLIAAIWFKRDKRLNPYGGATYLTPVAIPFIVANTLTLGLGCGYLIMKTDSI